MYVCMFEHPHAFLIHIHMHMHIPESEDVPKQAADCESLRKLGAQCKKCFRIAGHGNQPMYVCKEVIFHEY